jgi:OmcA/MtrC family decaheme c-type cytochrome
MQTPTPVIAAGTPVAAGQTFDTIGQMMTQAAVARGYTGEPITIENYAAEVAYPGVGLHCTACHVNDSYKVDRGPLGAVVAQPGGPTSDPTSWLVISPKAATCTACHDSPKALAHVTSFGQATFGEAGATQAASWQRPETCADCHSPGGFKGVDLVHGLK